MNLVIEKILLAALVLGLSIPNSFADDTTVDPIKRLKDGAKEKAEAEKAEAEAAATDDPEKADKEIDKAAEPKEAAAKTKLSDDETRAARDAKEHDQAITKILADKKLKTSSLKSTSQRREVIEAEAVQSKIRTEEEMKQITVERQGPDTNAVGTVTTNIHKVLQSTNELEITDRGQARGTSFKPLAGVLSGLRALTREEPAAKDALTEDKDSEKSKIDSGDFYQSSYLPKNGVTLNRFDLEARHYIVERKVTEVKKDGGKEDEKTTVTDYRVEPLSLLELLKNPKVGESEDFNNKANVFRESHEELAQLGADLAAILDKIPETEEVLVNEDEALERRLVAAGFKASKITEFCKTQSVEDLAMALTDLNLGKLVTGRLHAKYDAQVKAAEKAKEEVTLLAELRSRYEERNAFFVKNFDEVKKCFEGRNNVTLAIENNDVRAPATTELGVGASDPAPSSDANADAAKPKK